MPSAAITKKSKSSKTEISEITKESIVISDDVRNKAREYVLSAGDGLVGSTINNMIKSRFRIIYLRSHEETRMVNFFKEVSICTGYELFQWDCDRGLLEVHGKEKITPDESEVNEGDPSAILSHIIDHARKHSNMLSKKKIPQGAIYLLLDFHVFLEDMPQVQRKLREFVETPSICTIIIVSPTFVCPPTLEKDIALIDFPVPSYQEINSCLQKIAEEVSVKLPEALKEAKEKEEEIVKSASGLTLNEAGNALAMALVAERRFSIPRILDEKKQMIRKGGILEYREPRFTANDVGGLDILKEWVSLRKLAFKEDARSFGLPAPKGVLLLSPPGCGKSMFCDVMASIFNIPLLRLDFGAIFSSHVGDSELNMRTCLRTAESIAPCVFMVDEVEKGIGGVESSNATDGGVTSRVFGTMLTWMQDKTASVFVACTANNIIGIPPEFMRAGRFDEIFFLDLPNEEQRYEVCEKLLSRKKRVSSNFDIDSIVEVSKNYTPVEIEKGIDNALFMAYSDGKRELASEDIVKALKMFYPLYNSRREEIELMRKWALGEDGKGGRAILANSSVKKKSVVSKEMNRSLDLDL